MVDGNHGGRRVFLDKYSTNGSFLEGKQPSRKPSGINDIEVVSPFPAAFLAYFMRYWYDVFDFAR